MKELWQHANEAVSCRNLFGVNGASYAKDCADWFERKRFFAEMTAMLRNPGSIPLVAVGYAKSKHKPRTKRLEREIQQMEEEVEYMNTQRKISETFKKSGLIR